MDGRMRLSLYSRWVNTNANVCIHSRRCTNTRHGLTRDARSAIDGSVCVRCRCTFVWRGSRLRNKYSMRSRLFVYFIFGSLFCHFIPFDVWWTYAFAWMDPMRWNEFIYFFIFFLLQNGVAATAAAPIFMGGTTPVTVCTFSVAAPDRTRSQATMCVCVWLFTPCACFVVRLVLCTMRIANCVFF